MPENKRVATFKYVTVAREEDIKEALNYVDELPDQSATGTKIPAWLCAISYGATVGAFALDARWWVLIAFLLLFMALGLAEYMLKRKDNVRPSLRQDPYATPKYTWRNFAGLCVIFWPQVANFVCDALPAGPATYIAAAIIVCLSLAHMWWVVATDAWTAKP